MRDRSAVRRPSTVTSTWAQECAEVQRWRTRAREASLRALANRTRGPLLDATPVARAARRTPRLRRLPGAGAQESIAPAVALSPRRCDRSCRATQLGASRPPSAGAPARPLFRSARAYPRRALLPLVALRASRVSKKGLLTCRTRSFLAQPCTRPPRARAGLRLSASSRQRGPASSMCRPWRSPRLASPLRSLGRFSPENRSRTSASPVSRSRHRLLAWHIVARGSARARQCPCQTCSCRRASRLERPALIVLHNHPSGDPSPSPDDARLTARLSAAADLLDMPLLDHLIVGDDDRYFSFNEGGAMRAPSDSTWR